MNSDRRKLLTLASASAATLWLARSAWAQPKFSSNPFTLGVASGSPTADGMVLWTRLHLAGLFGSGLGNDPVTVHWEVAHDEGFSRMAQSGQTIASVELAHSIHVEVAGLEADRWYFYRFRAGDVQSAVGRTHTLPAPDALVARLRLAYASCQRWEHGYFSAYRHMAQENLDLVLFLGDYIYEYAGAANAVRPVTGGWVQSLADYRQRYALHKGDTDLQAMHAACPWLLTWDDHEVQNDYAGITPGYTSAAEPGADFATRRASAYQAWYEHMPVRASTLARGLAGLSSGAEIRVFQKMPYGRLANIHLLDPRQYKDPIVCTQGGRLGSSTLDPRTCAALGDPKRSMLGEAQEAWLATELAKPVANGTAWQVLGQGSLLGPRNFKANPEKLLWNDGWDGYPAARQRLADTLQKNMQTNPATTAVVLGGDVHENWVGHVKSDYNDKQSASVGVEFCGTSITSRSGNGAAKIVEGWLAENSHFLYAETRSKGYGVCEFTPKQLTTTLRVVDDVTRKDAAISNLASFSVKAGQAVVERI